MTEKLIKDGFLKSERRKIQEATQAIKDGRGMVLNCDFKTNRLIGTGLEMLITTDQQTGRGIIEIVESKK